jgi:hypothetical protein
MSVDASPVSSCTSIGRSELGSVPMPAMIVPPPVPEDLSPEQAAAVIPRRRVEAASLKRMSVVGEG